MITVGLVRELQFISRVLKTPVELTFSKPLENLSIKIENDILFIWYRGYYIWQEVLEGSISFFGIESADTISRIIACIDNDDDNWKRYRHLIKSDKPKTS